MIHWSKFLGMIFTKMVIHLLLFFLPEPNLKKKDLGEIYLPILPARENAHDYNHKFSIIYKKLKLLNLFFTREHCIYID